MKKRSVSLRINLLILVLVAIICTGLVTAAYWNNSRQIDNNGIADDNIPIPFHIFSPLSFFPLSYYILH